MNLAQVSGTTMSVLYRFALAARRLLGRQQCKAFTDAAVERGGGIEHIFVINLDRQSDRWRRTTDELGNVLDVSGEPLSRRATRVSAVDAREQDEHPREGLVESTYTLGDQLFVDPHPYASPERIDFDERIEMSPQEVAVACSHIEVWKRIASGEYAYAMVLEDDVWFHPRFARLVDQAWAELRAYETDTPAFDVLYLSYREVEHGAEKVRVSRSLFSPFRGLWYLSGYVVSKSGADKLLRSLPVRGPVDLWLNHQFGKLKVFGTVKPVIGQRRDATSNNSYSVLPILSRLGVLNSEAPGMFRGRPRLKPVLAFGTSRSGLSSLAMALSMLGYRCCSDVDKLPPAELRRLLSHDPECTFDAYVNVPELSDYVEQLAALYPDARLILTVHSAEHQGATPSLAITDGSFEQAYATCISQCGCGMRDWRERALLLRSGALRMWKVLGEFLGCVPPPSPYPIRDEIGCRTLDECSDQILLDAVSKRRLKWDDSPWVACPHGNWRGVPAVDPHPANDDANQSFTLAADFRKPDFSSWKLRDDTFPGNLALFRPTNFVCDGRSPAQILLRKEQLGIRNYSSAALSSVGSFLYGRFEAVLKASAVPGVVTGVFLHRDSPRQEIDIEFIGNRPRYILTNVYYNPGIEGTRFDYGYRGTPILIELDFDPTEDLHSYAIEWAPNELRWYVDGRLVHRRANWQPTPIPHLPMRFHVNLWPPRSRELAGRIRDRTLPAVSSLLSVRLDSGSFVHPLVAQNTVSS